jgi:hypothetical protein
MEYQGLIEDDVINVRALNRAWLRLAANGPERLAALDETRRQRLADAPFLLFTLRENDMSLWSTLLSDRPQPDLFAACPDAGQRELQVACLAWLWELARRNPYVARIVAGAPLQWCERVAAYPLVRLLRNAADADLVRPRFRVDSATHRRLMLRGGSALRAARSAAQVAAMQAMLTAVELAQAGQLPAAACRLQGPSREVADEV